MKQRIGILDGFRALAILSVMCFHYFSSWTPPRKTFSLYPYGSDYAWFHDGNLGVQFFFIISGFVIFFTIERTDGFILFWKKRLVRLLPSMVIASLITFAVLSLFDTEGLFPKGHSLRNMLTSITFLSPDLLDRIVPGHHRPFGYLTGPYWSLWPELQFYMLCSLLYYADKRHFLRNFTTLALVLVAADHALLHVEGSNHLHLTIAPSVLAFHRLWFCRIFNLVIFLPYFASGVLCYALYIRIGVKDGTRTTFPLISLLLFMGYCLYLHHTVAELAMHVAMWALFLGFIYRPQWLSFFGSRWMVRMGFSSYFLYLVHEDLGVLLINRLGVWFQPYSALFTVVVMIGLVGASIWYTMHVEVLLARKLSRALGFLPLHARS